MTGRSWKFWEKVHFDNNNNSVMGASGKNGLSPQNSVIEV